MCRCCRASSRWGLRDAQQLPRVGVGPLGIGFVSPRAGTSPPDKDLFIPAPLGCWASLPPFHPTLQFRESRQARASPPGAPLRVPAGPLAHARLVDTAQELMIAEAPSQPSPHLQETAQGEEAPEASWEERTASAQTQLKERAWAGGSPRDVWGAGKAGLLPKFPKSHEELIPQI